MESTELLRTIIDGLNLPPFNRGLTLVKIDSMSTEKLLQTLSDVLSWVEGQNPKEFIDIRSEAPDETAMRILSALRILKYPPPRDIDQIQRWRLDLLEGKKSAIYPILKWVFDDVDRLKERVYLGQFLTRIEIPLEEQSPEIIRLMNTIEQKMEEFKILHTQNVETRADFIRALDVRNDLKAMEEEREQLQRKIERCKRRTNRRPDLNILLQMAERLRLELERNQELQIQKQDQQKAKNNADQRIGRLERTSVEEERKRDGADPKIIIQKLQREIEVNRYLLNDKLEHDLHIQRNNLDIVKRILGQKSANDIEQLKAKIETLNSECMEMSLQRDRRDEASEDKLVVYRHQAANVQRKKLNVADLLQMTKQELENTELLLAEKKRELSEKTGKEEVITSVQYKILLNKLRNKSNLYKRKKSEMEQLKAEQQILERTLELLEERFEQIKEDNKNEGRGVIEQIDETINSINQRPKTAKPTSTDVQGLKKMVEEINEQISQHRTLIEQLNSEIENFHSKNKEKNEQFYALKAEFDKLEEDIKMEREDIEEKITILNDKLEVTRNELDQTNGEMQKQKWLAENSSTIEQTEYAHQKLERQKDECTQAISSIKQELNNIAGRGDLVEQTQMWQNLVQLFEAKLKSQQHRKDDEAKPWGDYY